MIFVGLVRHNITQLITSSPKPQPAEALRQQRILTRASALRTNQALLPRSAFQARLEWLIDVLGSGSYVKKEEPKKVRDAMR